MHYVVIDLGALNVSTPDPSDPPDRNRPRPHGLYPAYSTAIPTEPGYEPILATQTRLLSGEATSGHFLPNSR